MRRWRLEVFHKKQMINENMHPVMGMFYWGCLVCNYGFFEGQEQHSSIGTVLVSWLVMVDWPNIKHVRYFTNPP